MNVRKFHVYIIESPNAPDLYHKRFEGESLNKTLQLSEIPSSHRLVVDPEAFTAAFGVGLIEYFKLGPSLPSPIIHISAHGFKGGIELTNKKIIEWKTLRELLMPINKILNGGLILCVSSCEGSYACTMAMNDDIFPFHTMIGNIKKPTWGETNIGFSVFYHLFAQGRPLSFAVDAMKKASNNYDFQIIEAKTARNIYLQNIHSKPAISAIQENLPQNNPKIIKSIYPK